MTQQTLGSPATAKQEFGTSPGRWNRDTHSRNRDYSPTLGRFIERDPIGFEAGDNNWYRFVANGPTGKTDASRLRIYVWAIDDGTPQPGRVSWEKYLETKLRLGREQCDNALKRLRDIDDTMFAEMQREKKVIFDDKPFAGTKEALRAAIEREKSSGFTIVSPKDATKDLKWLAGAITQEAANLGENYDIAFVLTHGVHEDGVWTGLARIGGDRIPQTEIQRSLKAAYGGNLLFLSCGLNCQGKPYADGGETHPVLQEAKFFTIFNIQDDQGGKSRCRGFKFIPFKAKIEQE